MGPVVTQPPVDFSGVFRKEIEQDLLRLESMVDQTLEKTGRSRSTEKEWHRTATVRFAEALMALRKSQGL